MISLPDRFLSRLFLACGALFGAYVLVMITTIYFASYASELTGSIREREASVVALETEYYAAIGVLSESDPAALGFVSPLRVEYVASAGAPAFSRADR